MDEYISAAMQEWQVPGLAVAVVKDGEILVARGYGLRQVDTDQRVTVDTVFPIASCTKSFTAAAVAIYVDQDKLDWDDPVRKHFPDFQVADEYVAENATIRDLMAHRTGLVAGHLLFVKGDLPPDEIMRRMAHLGRARPFRAHHTYNNVAYLVVGEILERQSGKSWQTVIQDRLIGPLQMDSTFVSHMEVPENRRAVRHRHYNEGIFPMRTPSTDDLVAPATAIHSTVGDMAKWIKLHLQLGQFDRQQIIRSKSVQEMHALQMSIPVNWRPGGDVYRPQFVGTGLGWFTRDYRGKKVVQHGGGWGAEVVMVPEDNLGVVVLSNLDRNGLVWMLKWDLIDSLIAGLDVAWNREGKWEYWQKLGGVGHNFAGRDEQKSRLERDRITGTQPSQPLERFAGRYESPLYGCMEIGIAGNDLEVTFGAYNARLSH